MNCSCTSYPALKLTRASINKRISESRALAKKLLVLAEQDVSKLKLWQCPHCSHYWQTGREWNFSNKEYLFQVPAIEIKDWLSEPYTQPATWLIYSAMMADYEARNTFEASNKPCRVENCAQPAIKMSGVCKSHHIEQLQRFNILPKRPSGRPWGEYP
ncbi:hypothetical protein [Hymenobacter psoromatis]|uniref:hypothetical protein n=1 Tax=Hymenobacter psoromatis TaxID=1484116 RepID=UPI001CC01972|nr:hypothetical protein [Hymenobacter psoromatis]